MFIHRLCLAKYSNTLINKVQQCVDDHEDKAKLQSHLAELREMQARPARTSIGKGAASSTNMMNGSSQEQALNSRDGSRDPLIKPVSVDAPQSYRYWSG